MRSIVIGDVHGCYHTLMRVLDRVKYDPSKDFLYFLGDLVGKGPHSDKVMDFVIGLHKVKVTLGNHDLYWMYHHAIESWGRPDFVEMEQYENRDLWFSFLKQQEFIIEKDFGVMVHASVHPSWTVADALKINDELLLGLRNDTKEFLKSLEESPKDYDSASTKIEKRRANAFVFTLCRYYIGQNFDLKSTGPPEEIEASPWYQLPRRIEKPILFGHWAALRGRRLPGVIALDGAAVYGGKLMAYIGETEELFSVERDEDDCKEKVG